MSGRPTALKTQTASSGRYVARLKSEIDQARPQVLRFVRTNRMKQKKIVRTRPEPSAAPTLECVHPVGAAEGCDLFLLHALYSDETQNLWASLLDFGF
jgi:hypothetical protein